MLSIRPLCRTASFTTCTTLCNDIYNMYLYRYHHVYVHCKTMPTHAHAQTVVRVLYTAKYRPPSTAVEPGSVPTSTSSYNLHLRPLSLSTGYIVLTHCYNDVYTCIIYRDRGHTSSELCDCALQAAAAVQQAVTDGHTTA